jgi:hypothetical protein
MEFHIYSIGLCGHSSSKGVWDMSVFHGFIAASKEYGFCSERKKEGKLVR